MGEKDFWKIIFIQEKKNIYSKIRQNHYSVVIMR